MKTIIIDVETGGLDPKENALLQMSGQIEIDDKVVETFNYFIQPHRNDILVDAALQVGGFDRTEIEDPDGRFVPPLIVYAQFTTLLGRFVNKFNKRDKMFFIGYNAHSFDMPFVREWFRKCGDKYFGSYFFYPCIDVMILAAWKLRDIRHSMPNFQLGTVAKQLGIELDEQRLHDAMYDVEMTRAIYTALS